MFKNILPWLRIFLIIIFTSENAFAGTFLTPQAIKYRTQAEELFKLGDITNALTLYQKSVSINPDDFLARNALGEIYQLEERYGLAEAEFLAAIDKNPNFPEAYINLAYLYRQLDRKEEAYQYGQKAFSLLNPNDPKLNKIQGLFPPLPPAEDIAIGRQRLGQAEKKEPPPYASSGQTPASKPATAVSLLVEEVIQEKRNQEKAEIAAKKKKDKISGRFSLKYETGWGGGSNDQDSYEYLLLNYGNRDKDKFSASLYASSRQDLDGINSWDNKYEDFESRIYHAYIDISKLPMNSNLRLGRQVVSEIEAGYFDGVRLDSSFLKGATISFFGGGPTEYRSRSVGDNLWGSLLVTRLWPGSFLNLGYQNIWGGGFSDDSIVGAWYQKIGRDLKVNSRVTSLNSKIKDESLLVSYFSPAIEALWEVIYYRQELTIDINSGTYSPYIYSLGSYTPLDETTLSLRKDFWEKFNIRAGYTLRNMEATTSGAASDYKRSFLGFSGTDFFIENMSLSLTLNRWVTGGSNRINLTGTISQTLSEALSVSLGSFYSVYSYSFYENEEKTNTTTYFISAQYNINKAFNILTSLNRQDSSDQAGSYYTFDVKATYKF